MIYIKYQEPKSIKFYCAPIESAAFRLDPEKKEKKGIFYGTYYAYLYDRKNRGIITVDSTENIILFDSIESAKKEGFIGNSIDFINSDVIVIDFELVSMGFEFDDMVTVYVRSRLCADKLSLLLLKKVYGTAFPCEGCNETFIPSYDDSDTCDCGWCGGLMSFAVDIEDDYNLNDFYSNGVTIRTRTAIK